MDDRQFEFSERDPSIAKLLELTRELSDLECIGSLAGWDQQTYMPSGAGAMRAKQFASLGAVIHRALVSHTMEMAIDRARHFIEYSECTDADRALVRLMQRKFFHAAALPESFVKKMDELISRSDDIWKNAKDSGSFSMFRDSLAEVIDCKKEEARFLAHTDTALYKGIRGYDIFLDQFEPGLSEHEVEKAFEPLLITTKQVLDGVQRSGVLVNNDFLERTPNDTDLLDLTGYLQRAMGFDYEYGRQDLSTHPFTTNFTMFDVRLTTRLDEPQFSNTLYSSIHEAGHGLYEQGIDPRFARTPLGDLGLGIGMALHESQSRLWENVIGRSRVFWRCWYSRVRELGLGDIAERDFVRAVNKVTPSFIRVDADEVTYNLHILMRFELERDIFADKLSVDDLPEAWNEKFAEHLGFSGLRVPNNKVGILQDSHWAGGGFGYFPSYALGNMYAAQIAHAMINDLTVDEFRKIIRSGNMMPIREWLREKIHRYGALYDAKTILKMATGEDFNPVHFDNYLKEKFSNLYEVTIE